ncbi:MAG: hypothetical protein WC635_10520 [Bacteriovorax sp.]|jgi:hypothetical protein
MTYKFPFLLSILGIIGGVFIALMFGANEDFFKNRITAGLEKNVKIQSIMDPKEKADKIKSEHDKNWRYYQRYHFHANGIASLSLALLTLLAFVKASKKEILVAAYMISVGGFLYPFVWLFAAFYGPEMGRDQAKETFAFLGYMGGVHFVGVAFALYLSAVKPWRAPLNFSNET